MSDTRLPKSERLALASMLLIAFALRAWQLDLGHFSIDESMAAAIATQVGRLDYFPLTGIRTSFHFHNPPLLFYLLAPFFAVSSSPTFASLLPVVLGTAGVFAAFRCGEIVGGFRCGLIAAMIMATCPNAVEYSRRLWGHDFLTASGCFALWGALAAARTRSWRPLAGSFAAAVFAQSLHLSGIVLWLPGLAVLMMRPPEKRLYAVGVGAAILLASYLPWLVNEVQNDWPGMRAIIGQIGGGAAVRDLGLPVAPHAAWVLVLGDFWMNDMLIVPRPWMLSRLAAVTSTICTCFAIALLAVGIARAAVAMREKGEERTFAALLLLPCLGTLLLFGIFLRASVPPYLLPALAPAALGAAWSVARFRWGLPVTTAYAVASVLLIVSVRMEIHAGAGGGIPIREKRDAIAVVDDLSQGRSYRLMQDGRSPDAGVDLAYEYLLYEAGIYERNNPEGESVFVFHDERVRVRPPVLVFLRPFQVAGTAHLRIYEIPAARREELFAVLDAFPAPRR